MTSQQISFRVEGMTCDHCARGIERALADVAGVDASTADFPTGMVHVTGKPDAAKVAAAIEKGGYRVAEAHEPAPKRAASVSRNADLLIIGTGSAGVAAAIRGSELGARVLLIERSELGGTCVNIGCVPSKTLIRAAAARYTALSHGFHGVATSAGAVEMPTVISEKRRLVSSLRKEKYSNVLASLPNVEIISGAAMFAADGTPVVDGQQMSAGKIIIATGAEPAVPAIAGLEGLSYLTSTSAMELQSLPRHLLVVGAGYVALELAQAFARLGSRVTVIARSRLLRGEDEEIASALLEYLSAEGIEIRTSTRIVEAGGEDGAFDVMVESGGRRETLHGDQLLVATGRRPRTADLHLEHAGIERLPSGHVIVDDHLETARAGVYAAGDVVDGPAFVYVAAYAGRIAAENALTGKPSRYDASLVPRVTFTDPAVASIGMTEDEARRSGLDIEVARLPMSQVPRAIAARDTRGMIKLVVEKSSRVLVGAHMLAPEAGDLLGEAALAMKLRVPVEEIAKIFHPYLTNAEAFKLACQSFSTDVAKLSCCA